MPHGGLPSRLAEVHCTPPSPEDITIALLKHIRAVLSGGPYYIRLRRDRLVVRNASSGAVFDEEPLIAVTAEPKPRVPGVGSSARMAPVALTNPFQHPRIIIADFRLAETVFAHAFRSVSPRGWLQPSPIAVCHVLEPLEGGLSQIECRALRECMHGAGARAAYFWEGRELTDAELRSGAYLTATSK